MKKWLNVQLIIIYKFAKVFLSDFGASLLLLAVEVPMFEILQFRFLTAAKR